VTKLFNRRKLFKVAGGATLGGAAFFDDLLAEAEQKGGLSRDSVKLLLSANGLDDLQLTEEELDKVKDSFERTLESIRKIRLRIEAVRRTGNCFRGSPLAATFASALQKRPYNLSRSYILNMIYNDPIQQMWRTYRVRRRHRRIF